MLPSIVRAACARVTVTIGAWFCRPWLYPPPKRKNKIKLLLFKKRKDGQRATRAGTRTTSSWGPNGFYLFIYGFRVRNCAV